MNIAFKKGKIFGIIFRELDKTEDTQLFLGDTMHVDHAGECVKGGKCEMIPIDEIISRKKTIIIKAKDVAITYTVSKIKIVYRR